MLMRAGIGGLGLRPEEFWRLTPAELALMLGAGDAPVRLSRAGFEALMQAHPDQEEEATDGRI
jgi:uncharacterized phage protein (TIGR02216 family)